MKPTYEDIVKYHSQSTQLLVNIDCYSLPLEIKITNVIDGGAVFKFIQRGNWMADSGQWVKTDQVEVLHIFPPQELVQRIKDLEKPIITIAEVQKVLTKVENTKVLTGRILDELFNDLTIPKTLSKSPKKKKCKKKKDCK